MPRHDAVVVHRPWSAGVGQKSEPLGEGTGRSTRDHESRARGGSVTCRSARLGRMKKVLLSGRSPRQHGPGKEPQVEVGDIAGC